MTPNASDIALATEFVDGEFRRGRDPEHFAFHRVAFAEMAKREAAEFRTTDQDGKGRAMRRAA